MRINSAIIRTAAILCAGGLITAGCSFGSSGSGGSSAPQTVSLRTLEPPIPSEKRTEQLRSALLNEFGIGRPKNIERAIDYYEKAARPADRIQRSFIPNDRGSIDTVSVATGREDPGFSIAARRAETLRTGKRATQEDLAVTIGLGGNWVNCDTESISGWPPDPSFERFRGCIFGEFRPTKKLVPRDAAALDQLIRFLEAIAITQECGEKWRIETCGQVSFVRSILTDGIFAGAELNTVLDLTQTRIKMGQTFNEKSHFAEEPWEQTYCDVILYSPLIRKKVTNAEWQICRVQRQAFAIRAK